MKAVKFGDQNDKKDNKKNKRSRYVVVLIKFQYRKAIICFHYFQNQCTCGLQSDTEVLNCRQCEQTVNVMWNNNFTITSQLVPHNILYNRSSAL